MTKFDAPAETSSSALQNPPFMIKFVQSTDQGAMSEGSLHSSAFKGQDVADMNLGEVRKLVKNMYGALIYRMVCSENGRSQDPELHTFCSVDGTAVTDEITLGDYLELDVSIQTLDTCR